MTDYFDLGLRRSRAGRLPINGETVTDRNGLHLQFDLDVCDGLIEQVTFKASTCITLVAYVEMLARRITGLSLFDATRVTPSELIVDLEQVPPAKQDRAVLAVRALQAAIVSATRDLFIEPSSKQGVSP